MVENFSRIISEFTEVKENCPDLFIKKKEEEGTCIIRGNLSFDAVYDNKNQIQDTFSIEIEIPADYPDKLPVVKETGGRIPLSMDNHIYTSIGKFCLGANFEVQDKFKKQPTLFGFIKNLVVPFLYSFCHKQKFGEMPYGELAHGTEGIFQYYKEKFQVESDDEVIKLLGFLAFTKFRGHHDCPCGSGKRLRNCHGDILIKMKDSNFDFRKDLVIIFNL
ncbi:MAG TPA: SEC-C metal-binding domain-containing protein [Candidatus Gastranaerophilales bacterium]|nr:SEC-C metal-binding domain-containing protein [Candidatus Gastranaerophilales bacterium]